MLSFTRLGLRHFLPVQLGLREKIQISAKNCAKFVHAHSRKPHPNILRELCRCTPAQISHKLMGECQSIAQKGVRAIDARNSQLENRSNAAKTSVRAPGLSADEREHPFV